MKLDAPHFGPFFLLKRYNNSRRRIVVQLKLAVLFFVFAPPAQENVSSPERNTPPRGIFIVTKLSQISKWKSDSRWEKTKEDGPETYVIQRYVTNPYLVAGRKFDMRLYVLVTSYMPMTVRPRPRRLYKVVYIQKTPLT